MINKYTTRLEELSPENQVKIRKYKATEDAFYNMLIAEENYNGSHDRLLYFEFAINDTVRDATNFLVDKCLDEVDVTLQFSLIIEKLGNHEEWEKLDFQKLTLLKHIQGNIKGRGREFALNLAKSWEALEPAYRLVDQLEEERSRFAVKLSEADGLYQKELNLSTLNSADKKEVAKLEEERKRREEEKTKEVLAKYTTNVAE